MNNSESDAATLSVNILGKDYRVSCPPEEQESLLRAARNLDMKMREIRDSGSLIGLDRIAIMAALNLSHDVIKANERLASGDDNFSQLNRMLDSIEKELQEFNS